MLLDDPSWGLKATENFLRIAGRFQKKHTKEWAVVYENLERYCRRLNCVGHPRLVRFGFIHDEPKGVKAISQGDRNLMETRLYIYPDNDEKTLHLLTVGTKKTQVADIKFCSNFVANLRNPK